jgi:Flp pilus assembly pilin Flp
LELNAADGLVRAIRGRGHLVEVRHRITGLEVAVHRLDQVCQAGRDRGATSTEYALMVGFIVIAFAVGAIVFGGDLRDFYDQLATSLTSHLPTP